MKRLIATFLSILFFINIYSLALAGTIKINEFYSMGDSDWAEIYFDSIDTSLYQLIDSLGTNPKLLSAATCSGNFCTIDWSNRLNNNGDTIKLVSTSSGEIIDQIIYGDSKDISTPDSGQSAGRKTDGVGEWVIFSSPTKGSSNNSATIIPSPTPIAETPTATSPTASPTPTSAPSPTPTPTKKPAVPTKLPTKLPTKKPTSASVESSNLLPESILGSSTQSASPTPTPEATDENNIFSFKNLIFVAGGIILILLGIFAFTFIAKDRFKKI